MNSFAMFAFLGIALIVLSISRNFPLHE